ncbi:MAG: hypothetical protein KKB50_08035 [Planctomycetes bacterium]|nr:hypothetical protein [Planctomycetota bacterium]
MTDARNRLMLVVAALLLLSGCQPGHFDDALPTTFDVIDLIRSDTDLSVQQKREQFAELGLSPLMINVMLQDETFGNQYGGDEVSAWQKVSGERFTELTPDEIQIYADAAVRADENVSIDITDAEAQAIVDLFAEYEISSPDDLSDFIADPTTEVPSSITEATLQELFIDFDPDKILDLLP